MRRPSWSLAVPPCARRSAKTLASARSCSGPVRPRAVSRTQRSASPSSVRRGHVPSRRRDIEGRVLSCVDATVWRPQKTLPKPRHRRKPGRRGRGALATFTCAEAPTRHLQFFNVAGESVIFGSACNIRAIDRDGFAHAAAMARLVIVPEPVKRTSRVEACLVERRSGRQDERRSGFSDPGVSRLGWRPGPAKRSGASIEHAAPSPRHRRQAARSGQPSSIMTFHVHRNSRHQAVGDGAGAQPRRSTQPRQNRR